MNFYSIELHLSSIHVSQLITIEEQIRTDISLTIEHEIVTYMALYSRRLKMADFE